MTAHHWRTFHLVMIFVWIGLAVPSILLWSESLLWVIFISLYANIVSHMGAWQATRAEEAST